MTSCLVICAEVSIGQKLTAKALAFLEVFSVKAIASSFEQIPEHILAGACLVTSQHRDRFCRLEPAKQA
jgi:hypothetical protein